MSRFLWIKNTQNFHITKSNNKKKKFHKISTQVQKQKTKEVLHTSFPFFNKFIQKQVTCDLRLISKTKESL